MAQAATDVITRKHEVGPIASAAAQYDVDVRVVGVVMVIRS
jgi:hypothetical protein